jgi:hypothetical protein
MTLMGGGGVIRAAKAQIAQLAFCFGVGSWRGCREWANAEQQ